MGPKTSGDSAGQVPRDLNPEMAAVRGDPLSIQTTNIIMVQARCKHIPDDLGRWQVNIVTTIF